MTSMPADEELVQKVTELEKELAAQRRVGDVPPRCREPQCLLMEQTLLAIVIIQDGRIVYANKAYSDLSGWPLDDVLKWTMEDTIRLIHPEHREMVIAQGRKKMLGQGTGIIANYQYRGTRKDGEERWVDQYSKTIDYNGRPADMVSMIDITERKRSEEALKESEGKLRTIIEHSNELFYIHDTDHRLTYVSPTSVDILGYTPDEMMVRWTDLVTASSINRKAVAVTETAIKTGKKQPPYLLELGRKNGTPVLLEIEESPIKDSTGRVVALSGAARDVGEKIRAETTLRHSEARFRDLFNSISDLVYTQDLDGRFVTVNPALCRTFGYKKEQIIGRPASDFMKPEIRGLYHSQYLDPIKQHGSHDGVASYLAKDGRKVYIEYRSTFVQAENGAPFISGTGRDVTERVLAKRQIEKLQKQMIQAQKMEAIGTLAGGIAHDFNNILGIIIGNVELAMDDVPDWNPARVNLEEIRIAGTRARDVVRQLLSFSRKTEQHRKPIKLDALTKESARLLRASIPTTIDIRLNIAGDIRAIEADATQIHQVIINLCTNAAHAMEASGGVLTIGLREVEFDEDTFVGYRKVGTGKYAQLTISDTGKGIDAAIREKIFDPYFTTKEVGKGIGMGLAVVHGIVKSHDGAISVYSEPGQGTVVKVLFPVTDAAPAENGAFSHELPTGSEAILFVDDEESIVRIGAHILEKLGYRPQTMTDPVEALELFRADPNRFDLVITDMTMPRMTGDRLARELLKIRPGMPIILSTGFSEKLNAEKAGAIGAKGYIEKPIDRRLLAAVVREVLDGV